jgi:hypothetical protein
LRELIDAGVTERPSRQSVARTVVAVSAGLSTFGLIHSAAASVKASLSTLGTKAALGVSVVKWVGVCAVGGAVGIASSQLPASFWDVSAASQIGAPAVRTAALHEKATRVDHYDLEPPPAIEIVEPAPVAADDEAALGAVVPEAIPVEASSVAPVDSRSRKQRIDSERPAAWGLDEIRLIDDARQALRRGDPVRALRLLGQHQRWLSAGRLGPEAQYLKMEALWAVGDKAAARAAAEQLLKRPQSGMHRTRALQVLASAAL